MDAHFGEKLVGFVEESIATKRRLLEDKDLVASFGKAASLVTDRLRNGGRVYFAGNGGSAADAQHIAAELVGKLGRHRPAIPAESLTTDTSAITAIANDFGYEEIFARQIDAKAGPNDVFVAISTSGRSPNILRAVQRCKAKGVATIAFTGGEGGLLKTAADISLTVPSDDTNRIQEAHITLGHALCACIEGALYPA